MNPAPPNPLPPSESNGDAQCSTESRDSVYFYDDGPWDTTVGPRPSGVPRFWPADVPLPVPPSAAKTACPP